MAMQDGGGNGFSLAEILGGIAALATAVGGAIVALRGGRISERKQAVDIVESNIKSLGDIIEGLSGEITRLKTSRDEEASRATSFEDRARKLENENYDLRTKIRTLERANVELAQSVSDLQTKTEVNTHNVRKVANETGVEIDDETDLEPPPPQE